MNNRSQYSGSLRRLQTAKAQFEMLQRAMDEAQKNLEISQKEVDDLKADLSGKRTAHLLLSVLEKKETLRKRRIDEIGKSIEELRLAKKKQLAEEQGCTPFGEEPLFNSWRPPRADHVQDTLATLRSYDIRFRQLASQNDVLNKLESEHRLLNLISTILKKPADDPEVITSFTKCRAFAQQEAAETIRYISPLSDECQDSDVIDLDVLVNSVAEEEQDLQRTNDYLVALSGSCSQSLKALAVFNGSTIPILKESLDEDVNATRNYVNKLRQSIDNECSVIASRNKPVGSSRSRERTVRDLEKDLVTDYGRRKFLDSAVLHPPSGSADSDEGRIIDKYQAHEARLQDRITKLLTRKVEKSRLGEGLVRDIEVLIKEVDLLAGFVR